MNENEPLNLERVIFSLSVRNTNDSIYENRKTKSYYTCFVWIYPPCSYFYVILKDCIYLIQWYSWPWWYFTAISSSKWRFYQRFYVTIFYFCKQVQVFMEASKLNNKLQWIIIWPSNIIWMTGDKNHSCDKYLLRWCTLKVEIFKLNFYPFIVSCYKCECTLLYNHLRVKKYWRFKTSVFRCS